MLDSQFQEIFHVIAVGLGSIEHVPELLDRQNNFLAAHYRRSTAGECFSCRMPYAAFLEYETASGELVQSTPLSLILAGNHAGHIQVSAVTHEVGIEKLDRRPERFHLFRKCVDRRLVLRAAAGEDRDQFLDRGDHVCWIFREHASRAGEVVRQRRSEVRWLTLPGCKKIPQAVQIDFNPGTQLPFFLLELRLVLARLVFVLRELAFDGSEGVEDNVLLVLEMQHGIPETAGFLSVVVTALEGDLCLLLFGTHPAVALERDSRCMGSNPTLPSCWLTPLRMSAVTEGVAVLPRIMPRS